MQPKPTLFIVTKNYPPVICGVGDYAQQLNQRLKALGYHSVIITSYQEVNETNMQDFVFLNRWDLKSIVTVVKKINKQKGILILQYVPYTYSKIGMPFYLLLLVFFCRMSGLRVTTYFHEVANRLVVTKWKLFPLSLAQRVLAYAIYLLSNSVATSNKLYQSFFKPFFIQIIPVPSNFEGLKSQNKHEQNKLIFISFINRCTENVMNAVYKYINVINREGKFYIVGKDHSNQLSRINEFIEKNNLKERMIVKQNRSREELVQLIDEADIYIQNEVVNEKQEGGISTKNGSIALALSMGKAMIVTKGDMTDADFFKDDYNCAFVEYNSEQQIISKIDKIKTDGSFKKILNTNAFNTYKKMCWDKSLKFYLKEIS